MDHDANLGAHQEAGGSFASIQTDRAHEQSAFFNEGVPDDRHLLQIGAASLCKFPDPYLAGQEDERLRMGRELHDSTGQLLLALRLSVAHLRQVREGESGEQILIEIDDMARQIDEEIRTFSFLNYPVELGQCGLVGALESLARGFQKRTGVHVEFRSSGVQPCSGQLAATLLRIAQEALMNVHRHARAESVTMTLMEHDGLVELGIRDNGQGMPPTDRHAVVNGVGLSGMRQRIERLAGRFAIRRLKHGTKLVASIPRSPPNLDAA